LQIVALDGICHARRLFKFLTGALIRRGGADGGVEGDVCGAFPTDRT
jgi:hypothetical protein